MQSDFKTHESGVQYKYFTVGDEQLRLFVSDEAKRLDFETFEEYKWRRALNKRMYKERSKGAVYWHSKLVAGNGGVIGNTYNKERAEIIKKRLENEQN